MKVKSIIRCFDGLLFHYHHMRLAIYIALKRNNVLNITHINSGYNRYLIGVILLLLISCASAAKKETYILSQKNYLLKIYSQLNEHYEIKTKGFPENTEIRKIFSDHGSMLGDIYLIVYLGNKYICNVLNTRYGTTVVLLNDHGIVKEIDKKEIILLDKDIIVRGVVVQ